jgi:outer membrane protein
MSLLRRTLRGFLVAFSLMAGVPFPGKGQTAQPLTLEEAVASAKAHHPQIAGAQAAEEQARSAVNSAVAARLPKITVAEDMMYSDDPVFAFGSKIRQARFSTTDFDLDSLNHPSPLGNFSASATANWTAFDAGSTRRRVQSAASSLHAAQLQLQYTEEQVATRIATLYYRVLMAEDEVGAASAAQKRAQEVDADIRDRVRAGLSLESDGARADLAVQGAQDNLALAKDNIVLATRDLFESIGEPRSDRPLVRPDSINLPAESPSPGDDLSGRLDLQSLRLEQRSARETLSSIKATAWPQITAFGHIENDAEHVLSNGSGNWTVGAKIQLNLFDGGVRKPHEQEALASIHRLGAQEREAVLEAHSNIAALRNRIADLRRRLNTAGSAIQVQQETLQTSRDRYASGLVSITEVLNGESELSSAEFQRIRTFYQLCIATADVALVDGIPTTSKAGH